MKKVKKVDWTHPVEITERHTCRPSVAIRKRISRFDFRGCGWKIYKRMVLKTNIGRETALSRFLTCFQDPGSEVEPNFQPVVQDKDGWDKGRQRPEKNSLVIHITNRTDTRPIAIIKATYYGPEEYGYPGKLVINGGWTRLKRMLQPKVFKAEIKLDPKVIKLEQTVRELLEPDDEVDVETGIKGFVLHPETWQKIMESYATLPMLAGGRVFMDESELVLDGERPLIQIALDEDRKRAIRKTLRTKSASQSAFNRNVYEVKQRGRNVFVVFHDGSSKIDEITRNINCNTEEPATAIKLNQKLTAAGKPVVLDDDMRKGKIKPILGDSPTSDLPYEDIEMGDMSLGIDMIILKAALGSQE